MRKYKKFQGLKRGGNVLKGAIGWTCSRENPPARAGLLHTLKRRTRHIVTRYVCTLLGENPPTSNHNHRRMPYLGDMPNS